MPTRVKSKASKKSSGAGKRGPAREITQGDAKVGKTSAGKPRGVVKGSNKGLTKIPGVVNG